MGDLSIIIKSCTVIMVAAFSVLSLSSSLSFYITCASIRLLKQHLSLFIRRFHLKVG